MEEEKGSVPVEAEASTQRLPTATRRQKRRGIDFFPGASRGSTKCQYLDLGLVTLISDVWTSGQCKDKFVFYQLPSLWEFVRPATRSE